MTIKAGYTRVSDIISPHSGYDTIHPDILANAANRGTRIHNYCFEQISGLTPFFLKDEDIGYFNSFMSWFDGLPVQCERRLYDDELMITGEIDIIKPVKGGFKIIDLKTSSQQNPAWMAQAGGYAYLMQKNKMNVVGIEFIHLQKNGKKPFVVEFDVEQSINLFKSCYLVYNHFYKNKTK